MPTYEYVCISCGTHVEVYQRFSDAPLTECGVCGGQLRKVFHPAGILFKGSGFYVTDSRAGTKAGAAKASGDGGDTDRASGGEDTSKTAASKHDGSKGGGADAASPTKSSGSGAASSGSSAAGSDPSSGSTGTAKERSA